ncbi:MAG: 3'-5' exonuclease [Kiritimatiellaeota bacterium]|nr:3'-5' exonuclease [Kiritimatiellota bacterium]
MKFPFKLDRPLIVFDIEATGISARADRIIELAAIRLEPNGEETLGYWLLNPGIPIPEESIAIHGITDEAVRDCPRFKEKALEILIYFGEADLAGFNAGRFDIPMLVEEFNRVGIFFDADRRRLLDAQRIFHSREPRDLTAALKFYCGDEHTDAHGAEADARATLNVIIGQFKRYPDLPLDMDALDRAFNPLDPLNADRAGRLRWVDGEVTVNFGKKKGAKLRELAVKDPGFLKWIAKNDFPPDTRLICENALLGIFPEPPRKKKD